MHSLLARQLRQGFGSLDAAPERLRPFLELVDRAYREADEDRRMLERSLDLSSQELLAANAELAALLAGFPDLVLRLDYEGRILDFEGGTEGRMALQSDDLVGRRVSELPLGELAEKVAVATRKVQGGERLVTFEYARAEEAEGRHFEARVAPLCEGEVLVVVRDISERIESQAEIERHLSLLRSTLDSTADGILAVDRAGRIVVFNRRFVQLWRVPPEVLRPRDDRRALEYVAAELQEPQAFLRKVDEIYAHPEAESRDLLRFKDGRVFERYSLPQWLDGRPVGRVWSFRDVTVQKRVEEQLLFAAVHDQLTGLHNRPLFVDRLELAVRRIKRHPERAFAVLFVDLDRFKVVNDSLGHAVGDELLVAVGQRLRTCVRPEDTVARMGGDEFTILLEEIGGAEDAALVAGRIHDCLRQPFSLRGFEVFTTASIGIALSALHYGSPDEVLRDADIAMYQAKARGKARHEVFHAGMHDSAVALLELENDLRRAADLGELRLHYQPIVALGDGRLVGFEALLRWEHPRRGLVYPEHFMTLAEETGLILPVGWWALEEACRRMADWQQRFDPQRRLSISVNLSQRQFAEAGLAAQLGGLLEEIRLPARCLALEITEGAVMKESEAASERLDRLRDLGVRLHVDDFGTGYSSLSYLHRFPIHALKIDHSFVGRIGAGGENLEVVRTITRLAQDLDLEVVAEGIETAAQRALLGELGCQYGQGYHFSEPADARGALIMIAAGRAWPPPSPEAPLPPQLAP
ncbi:MAG TPA: EAL domain-containing protein [Thermoanaerobaculia bacterium]|nr:EAL domain-containing protein [Thermoanaerobaculia bacterium]